MAKSYPRIPTGYPGVFYRDTARSGRVIYIVYKRLGDRKHLEDKLPGKYWTPAKANLERTRRIEGKIPSNSERRRQGQADKEAHAKRWTFSRLFSHYCELNPELRRLPTDKGRYRIHLQPHLGDKTPEELTALDVQRIRKKAELRKLSQSSIWHVFELIRRMSNFAEKQNLAKGISFPLKMPKVDNERVPTLTSEQQERVSEVLKEESALGNPAALILRFILASGLRKGDLFRLKWSDIKNDQILLREPKGGKKTWIPLNLEIQQILEETPRSDSEFIFPGRNGKQRVEAKRILKPLMKKLQERADLPTDFRPMHDFRHVFASTGVSNGIDLYTMQCLLTHKSPAMTQRYAHLAEDSLRKASEHTAKILAGNQRDSVIVMEKRRKEV